MDRATATRNGEVEVSIDLDRDGPLPLGGTVRGVVRLANGVELDLRRLLLVRRPRLKVRGIRQHGRERHEVLARGRLEPGDRTFPFSFEAPPWPPTHHGGLFQLDWELEVRVDTRGRPATASSRELVLLAGPGAEPGDVPADPSELAEESTGTLAGIGLALMLAGLGVLVAWALHRAGRIELAGPTFVAPLLGAGLALPGALFVLGAARRWWADRRLGEVRVEVDDPEPRAGATTRVVVEITPSSELRVLAVDAHLVTVECSGIGEDADRAIHRSRVRGRENRLLEAHSARPGRTLRLDASAELHAEGPVSFVFGDVGVGWMWEVEIALPGARRRFRRPILVRPPARELA